MKAPTAARARAAHLLRRYATLFESSILAQDERWRRA